MADKMIKTITVDMKHSDLVNQMCVQRKFSEFVNKCLEKLSKK